MEADEQKRAEYSELIKNTKSTELVYIDESGIELNSARDKGWGKKGEPLKAKKSGKYYKRINIIAGLVNNKVIAPMMFSDSCNSQLFYKWVEHFLIKELKQGQTVIMDNAAFHKSQKLKELIEAAGCTLIFLPPYSPDLNPIEKFWANMKRWIKDRLLQADQLHNLIHQFFSLC